LLALKEIESILKSLMLSNENEMQIKNIGHGQILTRANRINEKRG
jgi:hypothetical protein